MTQQTTALMGLAVHFYRPDFTEGQARVLIRDMLEDLGEFTTPQVEAAIKQYRRDPSSRFFPTSGQLRKLASQARSEEREAARHRINLEFGDNRPLDWEYHRTRFWEKHWSAADLDKARDPDRRARYDAWLAKVKAGDVKGKNPNEY